MALMKIMTKIATAIKRTKILILLLQVDLSEQLKLQIKL